MPVQSRSHSVPPATWITCGQNSESRFISAKDSGITGEQGDPTRGWTLMTLATATSVDALAVGLGLAAFGISVWYPSVIIGLLTLIMSVVAIRLGEKAGQWLGTRGQIAGGIVLLIIALKIVATHTL